MNFIDFSCVILAQNVSIPSNYILILITILMLIGMVFTIILQMFFGKISLNSMLLLSMERFVSWFKLKLIYIYILYLKEKSGRLGMGTLHKSITLMQEFFKALFLALHVSYYMLMTFLMILSVILLTMLMILLFIISMIECQVRGSN